MTSLAALPGFKRVDSDELYPVPARIAASVRGDAFRFTAETEMSPDGIRKRVPPHADGTAAHPDLDDAYEFAFPTRFLVNARGATSVPVSGLKVTSSETNGVWRFEMTVPLASVGGLPPDGRLTVKRLFKGTDSALGPAAVATLALRADGAPGLAAFELGKGDNGGAYPIRFVVTNASATARTVRLDYAGHPVNSQPCVISKTLTLAPGAGEEIRGKGAVLDDEKINWMLKLTENGRTLVDEKGVHCPNYGGRLFVPRAGRADTIGFKFAYYPGFNKMRIRIDCTAIADRKAVTLAVRAKGGAAIAKWTPAFDAQGISDEIRAIPDLRPLTVKSGSRHYELVLSAPGGIEIVRPFQRAAMDWEGNKYGLSDAIPAPFTPLKREKIGVENRCRGEGVGVGADHRAARAELEKISVVLRDHIVDKKTGLWQQVTAAGHDLLARPMRLVTRSARDSRAQDYSIISSSTWDVDGLCDWRLTLKPGHHEPFSLEIPVKGSEVRLMHACADGLRDNLGGKVPAGTGVIWNSAMMHNRRELKGSYVPYLWIGGSTRGISVFGDNDKGWVLGEVKSKKEKGKSVDGSSLVSRPLTSQVSGLRSSPSPIPTHELIRESDGTVVLRLNLVQYPVDLTEPRTIRLGFMATPVKPMVENWRLMDFGFSFSATYCWGGIGGVEPADGTDTFFRKIAEARRTGKVDAQYLADYLAKFPFVGEPGSPAYESDYECQKRHHQAGMNWAAAGAKKPNFRTCFYTNARGVEYGNESGLTYLDEWSRVEWKARNYGRRESRQYELDPVPSYQDYAAWWYRKMIETGACDDMYWDDVYPSGNSDLVGTDAYRLPDGTIQPSTGVFNMRALIKRCAMVQAELGKGRNDNWVHMTDTAMAPICSFAGVNFDMEDIVPAGKAYQQKYPKDYLEAVSTGRQFGNRPKVMAYYVKSTKERNAWYERTGAGMVLCYEMDWMWNMWTYQKIKKELREWGYGQPEVRVWNYWNEDEAYPLTIDRADDCASLVMAKKKVKVKGEGEGEGGVVGADHRAARAGEAIVIVSDFSGKGGVFNLKPDEKALGLKSGWKAFDFEKVRGEGEKVKVRGEGEQRKEEPSALKVEGNTVPLELKPYDFRIIVLK